jgi:hypothetical protein
MQKREAKRPLSAYEPPDHMQIGRGVGGGGGLIGI